MTTTCGRSAPGRTGAFAGMAKGAIFVDHTTVSAQVTRELGRGGGGAGGAFRRCAGLGRAGGGRKRPAFHHVRRRSGGLCPGRAGDGRLCPICRLMGPSGAGQLAKMMNQICIAGPGAGPVRGAAFGQKAGLDGEKVVEVISQGAAGSWQMQNRHKTMADAAFDFGFAVDWMRKDLGHLPRSTAAAGDRRQPAGHRAGRPVLQGCAARITPMGGGR
jgi:3-hydroxyisobutyrate dehydrogenase